MSTPGGHERSSERGSEEAFEIGVECPPKVWAWALAIGLAAAGAVFCWLSATEATHCLESWASIDGDVDVQCADGGLDAQLNEPDVDRRTVAERQAAATETRGYLAAWMALSAIAFGIAAATAVVSFWMNRWLKEQQTGEAQKRGDEGKRAWTARTVGLWWPVLLLGLAGAGLLVSLRRRFSPYDYMHSSTLFWIWVLLFGVSVPTIFVLSRSERVVRDLAVEHPRTPDRLYAIGAMQRVIVIMIGGGFVVGFVALAARWELIDTLPGGVALPSPLVVLFGAIFAAVAAIVIGPAMHAWLQKVEEVSQRIVEGNRFEPNRESELEHVRTAFGARGGLRGGLLGAIAVFAPLLLAALQVLTG